MCFCAEKKHLRHAARTNKACIFQKMCFLEGKKKRLRHAARTNKACNSENVRFAVSTLSSKKWSPTPGTKRLNKSILYME